MKIEEIVKDLDPVTIIEFKNYLNEHIKDLCSTKNSNSIAPYFKRKFAMISGRVSCFRKSSFAATTYIFLNTVFCFAISMNFGTTFFTIYSFILIF